MLELKDVEKLAFETNIDLDDREAEYILDSINKQINHAAWLRLINTDDIVPIENTPYAMYDDNKVAEDETRLFENK